MCIYGMTFVRLYYIYTCIYIDIIIYILDVRISADASRRTIATKGSCMPSRYTRKTMATHCTHIQVIIIIIILRTRCACAEALRTYIYIYIYTHRESLVRNHEPCAKALGNNIYRQRGQLNRLGSSLRSQL